MLMLIITFSIFSFLNKETSCQVIQFTTQDMYCQEPLLRSASRCNMLEILIYSTDFSNLSLDNEDIIESFKRLMNFVGRKEILIRRTELWQKVVRWVAPHLQYPDYNSLLSLIESKIISNTTPEFKYHMANLIGFISVLWSDVNPGVENDAVLTVINELWSRVLSIANRPYSPIKYHIYIYSIASVMKILNPPLKRRGKENLFRFSELSNENPAICSEFVVENVTDICSVIKQYFESMEQENIKFIDDAILVLQQTMKMVTVYDQVFNSVRECKSKLAKTIIEMIALITAEFKTLNSVKCHNTSSLMKKLSYIKLLGHDWWSESCTCYRFSNLNNAKNVCNVFLSKAECSSCRSASPLEFISMKNEICSFDWISDSDGCPFPSLQLLESGRRGNEILNREDHRFWGALQTKYVASQWKCIRNWLILHSIAENRNSRHFNETAEISSNEPWLPTELLVNEGMSALSAGGLDVLVPVQNCISYLTNYYYYNQNLSSERLSHGNAPEVLKLIVKEFIPLAKSAVLDVRKNEEFWPALEAFVEMSLGTCILQHEDLLEDSLELVRDLFALSETVGGISCLVIKHIANISRNGTICLKFLNEILAMASLTGSIHKKDHLQYMKANQLIYNEGYDDMPASLVEGTDHLLLSDTKVYTITILANSLKLYKTVDGAVSKLVIAIKEQASKLIGNRDKHYFENSFTHIVLIRMHQMFLCLTKMVLKEDEVILLSRLALERITFELGHQLSVRYLCEWTLMNLATQNNHQFESLILGLVHEYFGPAKLNRPNCLPSYIAVVAHIAISNAKSKHDKEEKTKLLIIDAMNTISPWCMSQQFTTRLYAQIFFKRIYNVATEMKYSDITDTFFMLNKCVSESLVLGDKEKNADKIMSDFYLTSFDPQINFNLENIFYDFPRLMSVLSQERVTEGVFQDKIQGMN